MKELASEYYSFYLTLEDDGRYLLEVLCGTVGVFTLTIELTPAEIGDFERDPESVKRLARAVSGSPTSFLDRKV